MLSIDQLAALPKELRLIEKRLIYSCDIKSQKETGDQRVSFSGAGSLRVGPKKSQVKLKSIYGVQEGKLFLQKYQVEAPGFKVLEDYKRVNNQWFIGEASILPLNIEGSRFFLDPLLFFYLCDAGLTESCEVSFLMGAKVRRCRIEVQEKRSAKVFYKNTFVGEIVREKSQTIITINKLKLKLQITRAS